MMKRHLCKLLALTMMVALAVVVMLPIASAEAIIQPFTVSVELDGEGNVPGSAITMPAGWAGMRITVGDSDITVTSVGRWYTPQSNATHNFLITATDGALLAQGISVTAEAGTAEGFIYADLATPVTLKANTSYYIVADYWGESDKFYAAAVSTTTDVASLDGIVILEGSEWKFYEAENIGWGPVDFKYEVKSDSPSSSDTDSESDTSLPSSSETSSGSDTSSSEASSESDVPSPSTGDAGTAAAIVLLAITVICCVMLIKNNVLADERE